VTPLTKNFSSPRNRNLPSTRGRRDVPTAGEFGERIVLLMVAWDPPKALSVPLAPPPTSEAQPLRESSGENALKLVALWLCVRLSRLNQTCTLSPVEEQQFTCQNFLLSYASNGIKSPSVDHGQNGIIGMSCDMPEGHPQSNSGLFRLGKGRSPSGSHEALRNPFPHFDISFLYRSCCTPWK